jgi:hypothetical protein
LYGKHHSLLAGHKQLIIGQAVQLYRTTMSATMEGVPANVPLKELPVKSKVPVRRGD